MSLDDIAGELALLCLEKKSGDNITIILCDMASPAQLDFSRAGTI